MRHGLAALGLAVTLVAASSLALAEEPEPAPGGPRGGPPGTDKRPGPPPRPPHGSYPYGPPNGEQPRHGEYRSYGRGPSIFRDVTDEQIEAILAFIGKHMPWRQEALEQMRQSEPERFRQYCRRLRFEIAQLQDLKGRDEAAFRKAIEERQLKMQAITLARKIRETENPREKQELTAQLREVLNRTFAVELTTHEAHIRGLEERIEQLRRELKDRAEHRQEIVEKRLQEALQGKTEPPFRGPPQGPPPRGKHPKEGPRPNKASP
ncbi:MAG: hypothetical protein AMS14_04480 [Planctomycetes bacterium DG_20]|nr:MAG: hypothetical protein AMS14_04480 [Planctomycetes bacterium DG_20]